MPPPAESSWDALLGPLAETPRENGTAALQQTASWLFETLQATGLEVEKIPFTAHPYALRLAGVIALVGGIAYLRAMRARRGAVGLALAVALPVGLLADLEGYVPVFSWIGARPEHHVLARLAPSGEPVQRLVFAAHYDTKTDLVDPVERAALERLTPPLGVLLVAGALGLLAAPGRRWARRLAALAGWAGALWGAAVFASISAGAFVPKRSPGAVDDGGSCAVAVRLAETLARAVPLERTEVEILLLAAEEVGVQGSWAYAAERFSEPPEVPTFVVNMEGLGTSMELGVRGRERFALRAYRPDPRIVELLDAVYRERTAGQLHVTKGGGMTDARSFLAHGIPAATLFSVEPGGSPRRGLHSHRDVRARLDESALEASVQYLAAVTRAADGDPLR